MRSETGRKLRITLYGSSHGPYVGCIAEGLPRGFMINRDALRKFMARRAPGGNYVSSRKETDEPEFLRGLQGDMLTGEPLELRIANRDVRREDYPDLYRFPRPGHADQGAFLRYHGQMDISGGGPFSGRLTAPLTAAGGIALQLLHSQGIDIAARIYSIGRVQDIPLPDRIDRELLQGLGESFPACLSPEQGKAMLLEVARAAEEKDSVGGIIEVLAVGMPGGIGGPLFEGAESRLAPMLLAIPGCKGIEFGSGFRGALSRGSENNDVYGFNEQGEVITLSNNCGGILGGITIGMPLIIRLAMKPTPTIGREQQTIDREKGCVITTAMKGRHDPCIALRAVPVAEAATALVLLDMLTEGEEEQ